MRYYIMEPLGNVLLPAAPKGENAEVVITHDVSRFSEIDYDALSGLISNRLKLLMELYIPKYIFEPVVYLDSAKDEQTLFWRFQPPLYEGYRAVRKNSGTEAQASFINLDAPSVFTVRSPKGERLLVVRMAVAESALRRCILGLRFIEFSEHIMRHYERQTGHSCPDAL